MELKVRGIARYVINYLLLQCNSFVSAGDICCGATASPDTVRGNLNPPASFADALIKNHLDPIIGALEKLPNAQNSHRAQRSGLHALVRGLEVKMRPGDGYGEDWPWRILLIEDNPIDEKMVRKCLSHHRIKCQLLVLEDGKRAIDFFDGLENIAHEPCPDLVLLDIGLPYHNGLEVLNRIRAGERFGQLPVIVMTGSPESNAVVEAMKKAALHVFEKKADFDDFLKLGEIIKEVLEQETNCS